MAMIKCFNCKNTVSDLIRVSDNSTSKRKYEHTSTCEYCGYPLSLSQENWMKYPAPIEHFEFDIEAARDELYEMIVPAILDESKHYDVNINVRKYFWKFKDISCFVDDYLTNNIDHFVDSRIKVFDYSKKKHAEQANFALKTYVKQMENIETPGLGFDIITNSAASAIAYTALNKHEVTKQYLKQSNAASRQLIANLPFLTSDSMSQSDIFEYKHQIDQSLLLAQKLVDSNNFLADHPEFYSDPDRYDNGLAFDGYRIYDILKSVSDSVKNKYGTTLKVLGKLDLPKEVIARLLDEDYLYQIGDCYCTSTKYEKTVIQDLYWKEHPEEKQRVEAETAIANQKAYQEAENLLACGKYYESAVAFSAISKYKDSAQRSVQIWRERILEKDRIAIHYSRVLGLRENGTVLVSGKSGNRDIPDADMYTQVGQWQDIIAISNENMPCGLGLDGKIYALTSTYYYSPSMPCVVADMRRWENIVSFVSDYSVLVALDKSGKVYATGSNDHNRCDTSCWTNVKKLMLNYRHTLGITKDGNILATGTFDKNVVQALSNRNVVDIYYLGSASGDNTYACLQENGRLIVAGAQATEYAFLTQWEPITKLIPSRTLSDHMYGIIDKAVIGLTKDGSVLCESKSAILNRELRKWTNIVDLICEQGFIGLRSDGTVVTFLYKHDLSSWKNVVGIVTSDQCVVGICADGTILSAGECNHEEIRKWKLFQHVDTRNQYMDGKKKQLLDAYSAELESCRRELANTRGIFAGSKKKKLEKRIMELQAKVK